MWEEVVENLPAGVLLLNSRGKVVYVNRRIVEKTGVDRESIGRNPLNVVHPEDHKKAIGAIEMATRGEVDKVPYPLLLRTYSRGEYVWNEVRFREITIGGERYIVSVFTDVSERIRMQKKIEDLLNHIRFINKMLRHDLLNALTRIQAYAEFLGEGYSKDLVDKIMQNVKHSVELVTTLGDTELLFDEGREIYALRDVVLEVAESYNVNVSVVGDAVVLANRGIYSIFDNLLGNTVKHACAQNVVVEISSNDVVEVKVKDDGRGIPDEIKQRIFEEGFTTAGGSGLGLYIVKRLMEKYGGSIEVEDNFPCGTVFILRFLKPKD